MMKLLEILNNMNKAVVIALTVAYLYQILYMLIGFRRRHVQETPEAKVNHRFAAFISARNEEGVIGELVDSLRNQAYPAGLLDIYVLADNCTDSTAEAAARHGAKVYERHNTEEIGKGYALDFLYRHVTREMGVDYYDAYMVFDADNIVDPNFVAEMNKTFDTGKYDAITCYRNSKNFGTTWLSAAYSIWFLHEARYINYPRSLLGTTCMISGTGFLVSRNIMKENGGWPFHLLTEDIQFSVNCVLNGHLIGYCDKAMVYDEQPTTWIQSWKQRLRWSKGFYQVDGTYLGPLIKGSVLGRKESRLGCYDVLMTVIPAVFLTVGVLGINAFAFYAGRTMTSFYARFLLRRIAGRYLLLAIIDYYLGMIAIAVLTIYTEWDRIPASKWEKIKHIWIFPLFMASYIPITLKALFTKVDWQQIHHNPKKVFNENI